MYFWYNVAPVGHPALVDLRSVDCDAKHRVHARYQSLASHSRDAPFLAQHRVGYIVGHVG